MGLHCKGHESHSLVHPCNLNKQLGYSFCRHNKHCILKYTALALKIIHIHSSYRHEAKALQEHRARNQPEPAAETMKKIQDQKQGNAKDPAFQHLPNSSEHRDPEDSKILLANAVQAHWELQHYPDIRTAMAPGNRKTSSAISAYLSTVLMFISFASQRYDSSAASAEDTATVSFQNTETRAASHCP